VRTAASVVAVGVHRRHEALDDRAHHITSHPASMHELDSARNGTSAGTVHPPVVSAVTRPRWSHMAGTTTAA
jgi:hypothetical protein